MLLITQDSQGSQDCHCHRPRNLPASASQSSSHQVFYLCCPRDRWQQLAPSRKGVWELLSQLPLSSAGISCSGVQTWESSASHCSTPGLWAASIFSLEYGIFSENLLEVPCASQWNWAVILRRWVEGQRFHSI